MHLRGPLTFTFQHHSQSVKWDLEDRTQVLVLVRQVLTDGTVSPACLSVSLKSYFHAIMHRFQVFEVGANFVFVSLVGWGFFLFCFVLHLKKPVVLSYNYYKENIYFNELWPMYIIMCILRVRFLLCTQASPSGPLESIATLPGVWFYLC